MGPEQRITLPGQSAPRQLAGPFYPPGIAPKGDLKRAGAFAGLLRLIRWYGGDSAEILPQFGLDPACFDGPYKYLPYPSVIQAMGLLASLVQYSPTVDAAFKVAGR